MIVLLFIDNPQYGEGRGELLSPVNIDLTGKYLLLVYPGIHVSSKGAYSNVIPKVSRSCKKAIESDIKVGVLIWSMILKPMSFQIILN